jgi:putative flippase GtrA
MPADGDPSQRDSISLPGPLERLNAPVLVQFVKFGIVGVSNTVLAFGIYTVLLKVFGVWYLGASAIGFVVGAVNGFLLNRRWTFRGHVGDALTPVRWGIVQGCGLGLNEALLFLFANGAGIDKLISQAFATVIVTVVTFLVNRAWTFRMHPAVAAADAET